MLFTDGSVNPQSKIGYGAYLTIWEPSISLDKLKTQIQVKCFEDTSSTKLELQTLLWGLNNIRNSDVCITIYTDSQNIIGLPNRRSRLEKNAYRNQKNQLINNHQLYQDFFRLTDRLNYTLVKIQGHQPSRDKDKLDKIFSLVDKASRKALKNQT